MKQRRVLVTLELDTSVPLSALRSARWWNVTIRGRATKILQAQANVIRKKRRKAK